MNRTSHFHEFAWDRWPLPSRLKPYFTPERWIDRGSDSFVFKVVEPDGEGASAGESSSRAVLWLTGSPDLGVSLQYDRWRKRDRIRESYVSRGDMTRLLTFFRSLHDSPFSCGLFVPFEQAWLATKQFIESDGELPSAISWVDPNTLPKEAFPEP